MIEVKPGQYVVTLSTWGAQARRVDRVTPKCVFEDNRYFGARRIDRAAIIAAFGDKEAAGKLVQSINGARGERTRRERAADAAYQAAVAAPRAQRDKQFAEAKAAYEKAVARLTAASVDRSPEGEDAPAASSRSDESAVPSDSEGDAQ